MDCQKKNPPGSPNDRKLSLGGIKGQVTKVKG